MMAYHHGDLRRTLVNAARALVSEGQAWDFSLREVARRAGVSHNAPYNHFSDKRELLGEVAASGFRSLQHELIVATSDEPDATKALILLGKSYISFAEENPALYRLMFGPVLVAGYSSRPSVTIEAGATAKAVLVGVLRRGALTSAFAINLDYQMELEVAHLTCWAALHGLASLVVDQKAETTIPESEVAEAMLRLILRGLANAVERFGEQS
jgi:AcrR family transcriptional regulator